MPDNEKDCPLSPADWVNYLQTLKSQIITITLSQIIALLTGFAFFGSLIYFAELRDNIIKNLFALKITIAISYLIILMIILILLVLIGIAIIILVNNFRKDMKPVNELIKKIIDGEDDSNKIRKEWKEKIEKPKEKWKMFNNKKIKLMLKHSLSAIGFIALTIIFVAIGLFLIDHSCKIIYSLILQIVGVLLLSFWSLLERATSAKKFIAKVMNKIIPLGENPWNYFDKMCRTAGLGFVISGLIVELSYIL